MNKKYTEILPVGYIVTEGQRYLLLHPEPILTKETWANGLLQFSVARSNEYNFTAVPVYTRLVLVVHPQNFAMEIGYSGGSVFVWEGEYKLDAETANGIQAPPTLDDLEEDDDE